MPDFWQFPTVSMGLGPINAIYQARFMRYLENRGLIPTTARKIWAFLGDGETDEPETLGALTLASREKLDNLIFVVNCNLQRLDGPVRGNGKIIQELEAAFRGAGWNVIKVIWGADWDALLARDTTGLLLKRMEEVRRRRISELQGQGRRLHPQGILRQVSANCSSWSRDMSDDELAKLRRGGHDPQKVYNAYKRAVEHTRRAHRHPGQDHQGLRPGLGRSAATPPTSKRSSTTKNSAQFRTRFDIPIPEEAAHDGAFYRPPRGQPGNRLPAASAASELGGYILQRAGRRRSTLKAPPLDYFAESLDGSKGRAVSTTMGFVSMLRHLLKHPDIGKLHRSHHSRRRPHLRHGSRIIRQVGIYASQGQLYKPSRSGHAALLPRGQGRPDPGRGNHRSRLDGFVHRRRHARTPTTACP